MKGGLFGPAVPDGFAFRLDFVTVDEERDLVSAIERLEFSQVVMRGVVARRRTAHFGWTYGYYARRTEPGPPLPDFLLPLRARCAGWAAIEADLLVEALVTEYTPGASIGWHRDAPIFGDTIAGVSLLADCRMKFRPYVSPRQGSAARSRTTHEVELPRRSAYLLGGAARGAFEHSVPPVDSLRYSITFRTLRGRRPAQSG